MRLGLSVEELLEAAAAANLDAGMLESAAAAGSVRSRRTAGGALLFRLGDVLEYVPANQPVYWDDPDSGYGYEVTPMRTYEPNPGQYCREYQTVVTIGGRAEQAYGTACRQPDGAWEMVNS